MSPQTEAECLLENGALYRRRVGLRTEQGDPIFAGFKDGAFSLYFGDAPIYHFDLEGRWQRAFVDGIHYLKALDTTVQAIDRVRQGPNLVLERQTLPFAEASDLDAQVRSAAIDLLTGLNSGRLPLVVPSENGRRLAREELTDVLERIAAWDAAAWFAHRERYLGTYAPLPFLPPDCPAAVILQVTLGHEHGIAFGGAPPHEHAVRTPAEFDGHARDVAQLYGRRIEQCRVAFLAGGDILRRTDDELLAYLATITRVFRSPEVEAVEGPRDSRRIDGVHAFLDQPSGSRRTVDGWRALAEAGLRRVSLGVESGSLDVRHLYQRDWSDDELRSLVRDLKSAGLGVGVLTLAGAGGEEWSDRHLARTSGLLLSLELGTGDLVSLLDSEEVRAGTAPKGDTPASAHTRDEQITRFRQALAPLRQRGVKVMPYRLEKQGI